MADAAPNVVAAESRRTPDRGEWRMVREVFVADSDEEAFRLSAGSYMGRMMREYFLPLLGQFGFAQFDCAVRDAPSSVE